MVDQVQVMDTQDLLLVICRRFALCFVRYILTPRYSDIYAAFLGYFLPRPIHHFPWTRIGQILIRQSQLVMQCTLTVHLRLHLHETHRLTPPHITHEHTLYCHL